MVDAHPLVLVSGAPGAGKTAVAVPLARSLGFPLLAKDHIKETLFDSLGGAVGDLGWSRQLGRAAMDLLWALADRCPQAVLEANFRPSSEHERDRLSALNRPIVEVHCACPPQEAARRFEERARISGRHPVHALMALSPELLAEFEGPMAIGTVIEVDTISPVDMEAVVARVRDAIAALAPRAFYGSGSP